MLHRNCITIKEYENSIQKDEYEYLYANNDEFKGDNMTDENEGNVEFGNDFINCKIILENCMEYYYIF